MIVNYFLNSATNSIYEVSKHFSVDHKTVKKVLERNNIKHQNFEEYIDNKRNNGKKICQIDIRTNQLLHIFNSYSDANHFLEKDRHSSSIRMAVNGKYKSAYGYKWMKYKDYLESTTSSEVSA